MGIWIIVDGGQKQFGTASGWHRSELGRRSSVADVRVAGKQRNRHRMTPHLQIGLHMQEPLLSGR